MKVHELYGKEFVLSYEIFPPKTPQGEINLRAALGELAAYRPGFISVTYGAGGSTRDKTLELALRIRGEFGIMPLVHFTCVGANRTEIERYIAEVKSRGLTNILALRGDPPQGETRFVPPADGFSYASELVSFIRAINGFSIGVAGYPEKHLEAASLDADIDNLKRKVDAGANFIITQLFYNNNDFYEFMNRIRRKGINLPVVPGIMPVTNRANIEKVTTMCGAKIPGELAQRLAACGNVDSVCDVGIEYSVEQCRELKSWGVPGMHFYILNKSQAVKRVIDALA